jgi:hypothetical protein
MSTAGNGHIGDLKQAKYASELRPKNWTQKRRSLVNSFPISLLSRPLVFELDRGQVA